tara:strand:- start:148 stop:312 length:165 start_codon:yes stop_codon:yes gene_type:complete
MFFRQFLHHHRKDSSFPTSQNRQARFAGREVVRKRKDELRRRTTVRTLSNAPED